MSSISVNQVGNQSNQPIISREEARELGANIFFDKLWSGESSEELCLVSLGASQGYQRFVTYLEGELYSATQSMAILTRKATDLWLATCLHAQFSEEQIQGVRESLSKQLDELQPSSLSSSQVKPLLESRLSVIEDLDENLDSSIASVNMDKINQHIKTILDVQAKAECISDFKFYCPPSLLEKIDTFKKFRKTYDKIVQFSSMFSTLTPKLKSAAQLTFLNRPSHLDGVGVLFKTKKPKTAKTF